MGNLLTRLLGGLLAAFFCLIGSASAEVIPASQGETSYPGIVKYAESRVGQRDTPEEVCMALSAQGYGGWIYKGLELEPNGIDYVCVTESGTAWHNLATLVLTCPDGGTPDKPTKSCIKNGYVCPAGYDGPKTINGQPNMCEKPDCPINNETTLTLNVAWQTCDDDTDACRPGGVHLPGPSYCDGSCVYSLGNVIPGTVKAPSGATPANPKAAYAGFSAISTGQSCTVATNNDIGPPPSPPDNPPKPPPCKPNEGTMQTQNGPVCVPEGTPEPDYCAKNGGTMKTVNGSSICELPGGSGDGSGGNTGGGDGSGGGNGDNNGNDNGNGGGDNGNPPSKPDDCLKQGKGYIQTSTGIICVTDGEAPPGQNPGDDKESKDGNKFSGSCETGFTCTGDEAVCAAAKSSYELKCAFEKESDVSKYGKGLIEGDDPIDFGKDSGETIDVSQLFKVNHAGGSCPADWTFSMMGRTTVVSTSRLCQIGIWLGYIGIALSTLIAAFVVFKGND
jgi:hypothetical protein